MLQNPPCVIRKSICASSYINRFESDLRQLARIARPRTERSAKEIRTEKQADFVGSRFICGLRSDQPRIDAEALKLLASRTGVQTSNGLPSAMSLKVSS